MSMDSESVYNEWCWGNGELYWKGVRINGKRFGCGEFYNEDGSLSWRGYYFRDDMVSEDNKEGSCYIWNRVAV